MATAVFDHTETLFDYLPDDTQLITIGDIETGIDSFLADVEHRYDQRSIDPLRPLLKPEVLWLKKDELFAHLKTLGVARLSVEPTAEKQGRFNPEFSSLPDLAAKPQK
ncbi:transcription-repair coupling factor [Vibrio astriarenae]|nr:transcription-repair coupling factor [Vibrio sp. C7]